MRAMLAYAKEIFCGGIQVFDKKALIDDDYGGIQVLEHLAALRWITALPGFLSCGFGFA
jgi:hypothetical protein